MPVFDRIRPIPMPQMHGYAGEMTKVAWKSKRYNHQKPTIARCLAFALPPSTHYIYAPINSCRSLTSYLFQNAMKMPAGAPMCYMNSTITEAPPKRASPIVESRDSNKFFPMQTRSKSSPCLPSQGFSALIHS